MELDSIFTLVQSVLNWMNRNQGILTFLIFVVTMIFGWISGIFSALRQRPKLDVRLIDGPTFSCTFPTGKQHCNFDTHRTGIALYLYVSNSGSAPAEISNVEVGYHWHLRPFSSNWFRYRLGWFWLVEQCVALTDFQAAIGNETKVYPFLTQINQLSPARPSTYLRIGEATNGVVYFEQQESWGGCFPRPRHGFTRIKLRLRDAHDREYISTHKVPVVNLDQALKYNPRFGETYRELHGEFLPVQEVQFTTEEGDKSESDDDAAK